QRTGFPPTEAPRMLARLACTETGGVFVGQPNRFRPTSMCTGQAAIYPASIPSGAYTTSPQIGSSPCRNLDAMPDVIRHAWRSRVPQRSSALHPDDGGHRGIEYGVGHEI